MPNARQINATAVSGRNSSQLQSRYCCQVNNKQNVDVVMKLSASNEAGVRQLSLRYVLVIDVSGSMGFSQKDGSTLLDRVKLSAELVIENLASKNSLSIVTFSCDAQVDMTITLMNKKGKDEAKNIVRKMVIRGGTNLEIGLMKAIDVLKSKSSATDRDMIILFTDGMANEGETSPEALVATYNKAQYSMDKVHCVPLAAFTIGEYVPTLLNELAKHLGSDAFYWLNENVKFEAEMLIPVFLREATQVTDVNIEMVCLKGVRFSQDDVSSTHLKDESEKILKYFIHSLPHDTCKSISFRLLLPQDELEDLSNKHIVEIKITYSDAKKNQKEMDDFIILCVTTLAESKSGHSIEAKNKSSIFDEIAAFTISRNKVGAGWTEAQSSLVEVAGEKYRNLSIKTIKNAERFIIADDMSSRSDAFTSAVSDINKVSEMYSQLLGDQSKEQLKGNADNWISRLNFGNTITTVNRLGQLFAIVSSIETEMPTTKGVFDTAVKQPYLPTYVERALKTNEKKLKELMEKTQTFRTTPVFKDQNILVSETLRDKKVGLKRSETMTEMIERCGGTIAPNVNTHRNTLLICSNKDYKNNTVLVIEANKEKIPILQEQFIYDCIHEKKMLEFASYIF